MTAPAYAEVHATLYNYFVVEGKKYPGQIDIAGTGGEDGTFVKSLNQVMAELVAEAVEGQIVTYEPREIQAAFKGGGGGGGKKAVAGPPANGDDSPGRPEHSGTKCPIHDSLLTQRDGKFGWFESCAEKNDDDSWCNWNPKRV